VFLEKLWTQRKFAGKPPSITFIIVGKKHHVRFFPKDARDADKSGNCPPGMVVDQDIVSPIDYDFYLQSHGGLLGSELEIHFYNNVVIMSLSASRPSHYSVIEDGNNLGPDNLQAISYLLCHVYARATRSVSIPAPVYCKLLNSYIFISSIKYIIYLDADVYITFSWPSVLLTFSVDCMCSWKLPLKFTS
jgi:eukaryotic translation initiation factor 2C